MVYFYNWIMGLLSKKIFVFSAVLLIGMSHYNLLAQATLSATISPATIGKNEAAELRFVIENAQRIDRISPPDLKDFIVASGPNQETGVESINGVTRSYVGVTYLLRPRKKGRFKIPPVMAEADGRTIKSNSVTLTVTNSNPSAGNSNSPVAEDPFYEPAVRQGDKDYVLKRGENALDKINRNIFIKVDVNKNSCYVGEPVVVVYKLYTRLKSESSIVKNPSFNGFSVIDLMPPGNTYYSIEKLNGREYNVYTLRKSQLYPLQTGTIELESAEVENFIHFIKEDYLIQRSNSLHDLFGDLNQTTIPPEGLHDEKVTLRSKPVFITVKALPEENKSAGYNGAVGSFNIESALEKTTFTTDDAGKLRIVVTGEGNMTMVNAPDVDWPEGIEHFDPTSREQLNKYAVPVSGMKVFEYPFSAVKPGNYTLPAVSLIYFDPAKNSYKTVTTKPFNITVTAGSGKGITASKPGAYPDNRSTFFHTLFNNRWLIIVPIGILILAGLFVWLKKDQKHQAGQYRVRDVKETEPVTLAPVIDFHPLHTTEQKLLSQDPLPFYQALNRDFRRFLADKLGLAVETINKKRIAEEADKKGIPVTTCLQIQQLLDDIEWQLYTPFSEQEKMQEMYNGADELVHRLNALTV